MYQNWRNRESLNSSGTVSRKTSTASEYTPEHTYTMNRPMNLTDQTNVIYAAENCVSAPAEAKPSIKQIVVDDKIETKTAEALTEANNTISDNADDTDAFRAELNDSLLHKDDIGKLVPGQKVNLKVFVMSVNQEGEKGKTDNIAPSENSEEKTGDHIEKDSVLNDLRNNKIEKNGVDVSLKIPQRKISRFLVSPVLSGQLDVPKDKDFGSNSTPQVQVAESVVDEKKIETGPVQNISNQSIPAEIATATTTSHLPALNNVQVAVNNISATVNVAPVTVNNEAIAPATTVAVTNNAPAAVNNVVAPVNSVAVPINNFAAPVNNVAESVNNMTASVISISAPVSNVGAQINNAVPPINNTMAPITNLVGQVPNVTPAVTVQPLANSTPVSVEPLRKISAPLESTRDGMELDRQEQKTSVCSLKEEITKEEPGQVCGPELINTLEQLKISLDNLKHSSHPKKDSTESDPKKVASNIDVGSKTATSQLPQTSASQVLPPIATNLSAQPTQNIPQPHGIPQQQTMSQPSVAAPTQQPVPQPIPSQSQPVLTPSAQVITQQTPQTQQNMMAGQGQSTIPLPVLSQNIPTSVPQAQVQPQQSLPTVQQNLITNQPVLTQPQIVSSAPQMIHQVQPGLAQGQHNQVLPQTHQSMHQSQQNIQQVQQSIPQSQMNITQSQQGIPQNQHILPQTQPTMPQSQQMLHHAQQGLPQPQQNIQQSHQCVPQSQPISSQSGVLQTQPVLTQPQSLMQSQNLHSQSQPMAPQVQQQHIITSQPLSSQTANMTPPVIASSVPSSISQNFVPLTMPQYNTSTATSQAVNFLPSASVPQQVVTPAQPNLTTMTTQAIQPPIQQVLPPGSLPPQDVALKVNIFV